MGFIRIGTSGYVYKHWRSVFYPPGLASKHWLRFYAERFDTVELNATFYRLPSEEAARAWRAAAPPGFIYACKGSRFLTHMKRLNDTDEGLTRYFHPIRELGRTLGPVLWQLPAQMSKPHLPKLENFLQHLPEFTSHAFEFRHPNWYSEEVCDLLDHYGVAFCEHDWVPLKPPRVTGGYRYLRFHGASSRYNGLYGDALKGVAEDLAAWRPKGTAFVYFNNDLQGHAVLDAGRLKDLLGLPRIPKSRPPRLQCS